MNSPLYGELSRLLLVAALGAVAGTVLGGLPWGLVVGTVGSILLLCVWHATQLVAFERWLRGGSKRSRIPELGGIWDVLTQQVYLLKKRSRARKKRLAAMLSRFNASTSALPDAVVILARHGEIEWVNRAAQQLLGIGPRDVGQRVLNLVRDPAFHEFYAQADEQGELELESPARPGVLLHVRMVPFAGHKRLLMARDMSEQARVRQMRRDFVANVSHELRTPLTVIAGYLDALSSERDMPRELRTHLATLQQQTQRMSHLVDDLLTLSRLESNALKPSELQVISVSTILAGLVEDARQASAVTGHRLVLECEPGLELRGRETEITSVFNNLIQNAVQHTPDGTRVNIRWRRRDGGGACFEVEDNGPGIDSQHVERLTERFYRADAGRSRDLGGTGLGLSIVKHILQRHDAHLRIDSSRGRGAHFTCLFNAAQVVDSGPGQRAAG